MSRTEGRGKKDKSGRNETGAYDGVVVVPRSWAREFVERWRTNHPKKRRYGKVKGGGRE